MLRTLAVLAVLTITGALGARGLAVGAQAMDGLEYETYTNERFGFRFEYPVELLRAQPPPEVDDGRTFLSSDGEVQLVAWGSTVVVHANGAPKVLSVREWYEAELAAAVDPTYVLLREHDGWFVISGVDGDDIYYRKSIAAPDLSGFVTFVLRYPASRADTFDPVATVLSHSFTCLR